MAKAEYCLLIVYLMAPTWAYAGASESEKEAACRDDAIRLCAEFIPDRDKITLCMQKKTAQLGPACRAIFGEDKARPK